MAAGELDHLAAIYTDHVLMCLISIDLVAMAFAI
jgi:hypothetical protein